MKRRVAAALFGLAAGVQGAWAQAPARIFVSTDADGLPSYSHARHGGDSELRMIVSPPAPSPRRWLTLPVLPASSALQARPSIPGIYDGISNTAPVQEWVGAASRAYKVPQALLLAVMHAESNFDRDARSPAGAVGLMQIMPATGQRYGVAADLAHPRNNIDVGARYLGDLLILFRGNTELALAAYNAGEAAVIKHSRKIPPYAETMSYVPRVMDLYARYSKKVP